MFRNMKKSELTRFTHQLVKKQRSMVPNPSKETLKAWELYDMNQEMLIQYYELEEAAKAAAQASEKETDNIALTTEVKIK